jgi:hypothetical protein
VKLALAALLALAPAAATAKALPRYGVFVYRNFCFEAGSGDVGGIGLTVIRSYEGDAALYVYSEGAIEWPLLADPLKIDDAGHLKAQFADRAIEADLSAEAAVVTVTHDASVRPKTRLPRVTDLGAKFPACQPTR